VRERHGLELAFEEVHRYQRSTGRCPWPPRTSDEYRLYSFLAGAVRIQSVLGEAGRKRFTGAFRAGLEKEFGLGPLAFEVKVAFHLMSRGFDVNFHDLEIGGGYDFMAISGGTQVEVECKHVSRFLPHVLRKCAMTQINRVSALVCYDWRCRYHNVPKAIVRKDLALPNTLLSPS
jgi:hypothetical protein